MALTTEQAKEYGKKGGKSNAKTAAWNNIVGWLVGDGGHQYKELLAKQSVGEELTKAHEKFMDRFESLLEYHQPKLARSEQTVEITDKRITLD